MDNNWLEKAVSRYETCNYKTLNWILSRSPLIEGFLNTKVNSITGISYTNNSGTRGPKFIYGWIQGRGLEALVTFAEYYKDKNYVFSKKILKRAETLYYSLKKLYFRDEHIFFLYDQDLKAIRNSNKVINFQTNEKGIFTYSDAFAAKGLFAASRVFEPSNSKFFKQYIFDIIYAVENNFFQMDETVAISLKTIKKQPNDFAPRMILLGAAGMFHINSCSNLTSFADKFIEDILDNFYCKDKQILLNIPNHLICNIGHAIEFCGFALEHYMMTNNKKNLEKIETILINSLKLGLKKQGIPLFISSETGKATSPYFPWWTLPESIRACAIGTHLGMNTEIFQLWKKIDKTFFSNFWQANKFYAYQTINIDGPVDYVPATPDLDPGYHTGISLLKATQVIKNYLT